MKNIIACLMLLCSLPVFAANPTLTGTNAWTGVNTFNGSTIVGQITGSLFIGLFSGALSGNASTATTLIGPTTSAAIASAVTDETGSGSMVFSSGPTLSSATVSGSFTGNAGGLINVPATQIAGILPLAAIPNQVVTNVPNSEIDAHGLYGQLQAPMRKPWHSIYICPSYFQGLREGESNIVQAVTNMRTNGSLTVASNLNLQMAVEIDVGGFATRTNSNWNYRLRNLGNMIWDTNTFPRGPWWINDFLHSNGFKSFIHFYATTKILPVGADEYICDYTGNNFQAWTNGSGTFPTNSFGPYNLCISADSATNDMTQLYGYGFDGVVIADGPPIDFPKLDTLIGNACLTVQIPVGWNNSLPYPGYANVNTGSFNASQPGQFVAEPANFSFGKVMMVQAYQSANANQNYTLGYQQIGAHASVFYDNTSQAGGVGDSGLRAIARDFPTSTKAYGAYINWLGYADNKSLAQAALTHGILASGWFNETQEGSQAVSFSNALQCVVLNQILDDPEQNMPRLVNDLGTNVGGVWATKLVDGSYAVGMFNDGASTTNMSVTWSQIGIATNLLIAVNEVPPIGGASKGTASGSFTNSISSGSYDLFLFTPVAAVQQGISQALVGGVGFTNGAIAAKTMSLNSPSGSSGNFLTVAGITQQVYFYIGVVGFAAGGLIGMPVNGGSFFTDPDDIGGGLDIREQTGSKPVRIGSGNGNSTIQVYSTGMNISFPLTNASGYYGFSSTNTLIVTSAGLTNTTSDVYQISVTAGTAMALKDPNGNQYMSPVISGSYLLKPNHRFTGTGVTATAQISNK